MVMNVIAPKESFSHFLWNLMICLYVKHEEMKKQKSRINCEKLEEMKNS